MSKVKLYFLLLMSGLITAEVFAEASNDKPAITIRKIQEQTVLYTIYRGSYDKIGPVIGELFATAGKKGIYPRGQMYYVYLNNPNSTSAEHWLTEIRIPVGKNALKSAGTLGKFTDVKTLSATEVAVAVKPEGQADPGPIYDGLLTWIIEQGYIGTDSPREVFLTNGMFGDYAQMKTEIMFPIKKISPKKE